jgi:hypothetical protein
MEEASQRAIRPPQQPIFLRFCWLSATVESNLWDYSGVRPNNPHGLFGAVRLHRGDERCFLTGQTDGSGKILLAISELRWW